MFTLNLGGKSMKVHTSVVVCILGFFAGVSQAGPTQWSSAAGGNDHYYQAVLIESQLSWVDARDAAVSMGGYLVTLHSEAENQFIYDLVKNNPSFWSVGLGGQSVGPWLGGFQLAGSPEPSGNWGWVTAEPFSFTKWSSGEPNNHQGNEHYLHIYSPLSNTAGDEWNDIPLYDYPHSPPGFIVEFNENPNPIPVPSAFLLCLFGIGLCRSRLKKQ